MRVIDVYDSLLDVPLDEAPKEEGDDSTVPGEPGVIHAPPEPRMMMAAISRETAVVPFRGPFRVGMRAPGIKAMKRAGSRAGYVKWHPFDGRFYRGTREWLLKFQGDNNVPATGVYDTATHARMARFYDAYSINYLLVDPADAKDALARKAFLANIMYLYNRRYQMAYSQARPWDGRRPPWRLDCSSTGEWCGYFSPVGLLSGYTSPGWGNTDTQLSRFRSKGWMRSGIKEAALCDPKYYGRGTDPSHVSFFIGKSDGVSRVASFGSYPMKILAHDYRHDGIAVCNLTGHT